MPESLTDAEVRRIATLARLRIDESQIARYRTELSTILNHMARLQEIDVSGVEPLTHPVRSANRLAEDVAAAALPVETILEAAPQREANFISVPKVIGSGE